MAPFLLIATILFSLALALPLVQMATGLPGDAPLAGMETAAPAPVRSPAAWWNGALQREFDAWLGQRLGFRGALVRTANQIHYALFDELATTGGDKVVPGRAGWFYEKVYVDAFRRGGAAAAFELRRRSAELKRLQDRLAQDGIAFHLVIAPSKAEIYPEFLPAAADAPGRARRRSVYEDMIGVLQADGVHVLDAHRLFADWKRAPGAPPLFPKGGTHWNHYGAVRVAALLLERLAERTGRDYPAVDVVGAVVDRKIRPPDNDLGELANLWQRRSLAGPQVHPQVEIRRGTCRPDVLFIVDSFGAQLVEWLQRQRLVARHDTYFYNSRHFAWPRKRDAADAAAPRRAGLERLAGRDAVVVEAVEVLLPTVGHGFVEETLAAYAAYDAQLAAGPRPEAAP
ncbi:MAG: hypothetical protein AB7V22_11590 [Kiritimatiellia bacterium]